MMFLLAIIIAVLAMVPRLGISLAAYVASISPPFIITILLHIIFAELIVIFLIRRSLGGIFYLRAAEVVYQDLLDLIWPFVRLMFHRHIEAEVEAAWTEDTEDTDDSSTVFGDDDDLLNNDGGFEG